MPTAKLGTSLGSLWVLAGAHPSVAIGGSKRKEGTVWPRLVDRARKGRSRVETVAVGTNLREAFIDRKSPICIKQRGRGGAVREAEAVADGPFAVCHSLLQPS